MMRKQDGVMIFDSCGHDEEQQEDAEDFITTTEQTDDELIETEESASFEGKPADDSVTCDECGKR